MSATPQRMLDYANARIHDATVLAQSLEAETDAAALLTILGFEVLLKCALLVSGIAPPKSHIYFKLWSKLPESAKTEILTVASARLPGYTNLTDIEHLLTWYQYIFEKARYPYEIYEGYTFDEERELGELWKSLGAPSDEAVIQYHPMELEALIAGLRSYIQPRVP